MSHLVEILKKCLQLSSDEIEGREINARAIRFSWCKIIVKGEGGEKIEGEKKEQKEKEDGNSEESSSSYSPRLASP